MKKIFITAALLCLYQLTYSQNYQLGIKGGFNLSSFRGDNDNLNPIAGFHAGVFIDYKLSEIFSVQSEILYSGAGAKNSIDTAEGKFRETLRLGYVSVPVMLKYYPVKRLSIGLGGEAGWMVSARVKYDEASIVSEAGTCNKCTMDLMEKFTVGIKTGVGYELDKQFIIEARYHLGLTDVYKNNNAVSGTFRNSILQLSIGYKL